MQVYLLYCETSYSYLGRVVASQCPEAQLKEVTIDLQYLNQLNTEIPSLDASVASKVFSIGFCAVVFCFLLGRCVGEVLRLIRKG